MTCVASTIYGKRCQWDISSQRFFQISTMLNGFEMQAPSAALPSLRHLAQLCLCTEYHQGQTSEVINGWKAAIRDASRLYESGAGLRERNRELLDMLSVSEENREELEKRL